MNYELARRGLYISRKFSTLPQTTDLLDRYRALVSLGKIQYDEEQVRVVMKVH